MVGFAYEKGRGKQSPQFGLTEAYPRFCGDFGDRQTVTSIDVNGVKVPVDAYCYPRPKCTLADGFKNGFHLFLRGSGPKRTRIAAWSSHVRLNDLAKVVRSLTRVSKRTAAVQAAKVAGRCSKAEAIEAVELLQLNEGLVATDPVNRVLCGPFVGPGSNAMVVSLTRETCLPNLGWAVLRFAGGVWRPVMKRDGFATLSKVGTNIREEVPIFRKGDSPCFPSGGTRSRIWSWNGQRFAAGAWKAGRPPRSLRLHLRRRAATSRRRAATSNATARRRPQAL